MTALGEVVGGETERRLCSDSRRFEEASRTLMEEKREGERERERKKKEGKMEHKTQRTNDRMLLSVICTRESSFI